MDSALNSVSAKVKIDSCVDESRYSCRNGGSTQRKHCTRSRRFSDFAGVRKVEVRPKFGHTVTENEMKRKRERERLIELTLVA